MTQKPPRYTAKELSKETWPDLEMLFTKPGIGDAWWCWCTFHHTASFSSEDMPRSRTDRSVKNRREKKERIEKGRAHGVLVYADDSEPVGWCQYGPREELPRLDHSRAYRGITAKAGDRSFWRITCFVVDKNYRKQGVATAALNAVLASIRRNGGGLVEAYPVSKTDQGPGYMHSGTVSMFEKAGFKGVATLGTGRTKSVVMRRTV